MVGDAQRVLGCSGKPLVRQKKNKSGKLRICLTMLGIEINFESIKTRLGTTDQGRTEQIGPALWIECEPT